MADYTLSAKLTADGSGFSKVFRDAFDQSKKLSDGLKTTGKEITDLGKGMTMTGAGMTAGFTMPFLKAIQTTGDFEASMTKAGAIAGASAEELKAMTDAALDLGATTSLSSIEVADAMTEMAAKGFDATQSIAAMPGVISAAEASGEDLALTADTVASALNAFQMEAGESGRIADILAMAANKTAAGVGDMGYAFKYAAPIANSLGIGIEELSSAVGLMTNAGLDGAQAGTTLRMALTRLVKPTKQSQDAMDELGFSAIDADGNFKTLEQIVGELNGSMGEMTEAQKMAALSTIFGTEAASGMNILLSAGADELANLTKELENSEGASAAAAAQMKDNLSGALENLTGAIESATISLMSKLTPLLQDVAEFVTGIIEKFNGLDEGTQTLIAFGAMGVAALGPLLTILGVMTMGLGGVVSALGFIVSPIGLVLIAITALTGGFIYLWNTSEKFRTAFQNIVTSIANSAPVLALANALGITEMSMRGITDQMQNLWMGVKAIFNIITGNITTLPQLDAQLEGAFGNKGYGRIVNFLHIITDFKLAIAGIAGVVTGQYRSFEDLDNLFMGVFGAKQIDLIMTIGNTIRTVFDTAKTIIGDVIGFIGTAFTTIGPMIIPAIQNIGGQIGEVFRAVWGIIQAVLPIFNSFFNGLIIGFGNATGAGSGFTLNLSTLLIGLNPIIKGVIFLFQQFGPQIVSAFQQVAAMIAPVMGTIGQVIAQLATTIIPMVMAAVASFLPIVAHLGAILMSAIATVLPIMINLFTTLIPIIMSVVQQIAAVIAVVIPLVANFMSALIPAVSMLIEGFMNIVISVAPAFIAIVQAIGSAIQLVIPIISSILQIVIHVITNIISVVTPIIGFIVGVISTIMGIIAPIVSFIAMIMSNIFAAIRPLVTVVTGVFNAVGQIMASVWQGAMVFTGQIFTSIGTIISKLSGTVSNVFNTISGIVSRVMGTVSNTISGVFEAIRGAWNGLTGFVGGVFDGIAGSVSELVGQVKGFVNGVIGGINSAVSLINKIPGVNIGSIPYLARGTDDFAGGFARINEGGRGELVSMPGGTQVIPHDVSMRYAREAGRSQASQQSNGAVVINDYSRLERLMEQMLQKQSDVYLDGDTLVGATYDRYDHTGGTKTFTKERWGRM